MGWGVKTPDSPSHTGAVSSGREKPGHSSLNSQFCVYPSLWRNLPPTPLHSAAAIFRARCRVSGCCCQVWAPPCFPSPLSLPHTPSHWVLLPSLTVPLLQVPLSVSVRAVAESTGQEQAGGFTASGGLGLWNRSLGAAGSPRGQGRRNRRGGGAGRCPNPLARRGLQLRASRVYTCWGTSDAPLTSLNLFLIGMGNKDDTRFWYSWSHKCQMRRLCGKL